MYLWRERAEALLQQENIKPEEHRETTQEHNYQVFLEVSYARVGHHES